MYQILEILKIFWKPKYLNDTQLPLVFQESRYLIVAAGVGGWIKKLEKSVITDILNSSINLKMNYSRLGWEEAYEIVFVGSNFDWSETLFRIPQIKMYLIPCNKMLWLCRKPIWDKTVSINFIRD